MTENGATRASRTGRTRALSAAMTISASAAAVTLSMATPGTIRAVTIRATTPTISRATTRRTWQHVEGLTNHPTRSEWQPGAGGLCLHSIVVHPTDPQRLWVGIS